MGYWKYKRFWEQYKNDIEIFVESGTHRGDSVADAIDLGFTKIISVELDPMYYYECCDKFSAEIESGQVILFQGDSLSKLDEMLSLVNERAMFWIDAHGNESNLGYAEIQKIFELSPIKNHTFTIDDIDLLFTGGPDKIKEFILGFNPEYKFEITDQCSPQRQLIAYINE